MSGSSAAALAAAPRTAVIACGALAHEILALARLNGWTHLELRCLPALLHNRPEHIAPAVRTAIRAARETHAHILVAYAECGTAGALDRVLAEEGVERIEGPHCYGFFAGEDAFATLMEEAPGTFFLTDFLARQFERIVWRGLGLDRHPELRDAYFGNYTRAVHLVQVPDPATTAKAEAAAARLRLPLVVRHTGFGALAGFLSPRAA